MCTIEPYPNKRLKLTSYNDKREPYTIDRNPTDISKKKKKEVLYTNVYNCNIINIYAILGTILIKAAVTKCAF